MPMIDPPSRAGDTPTTDWANPALASPVSTPPREVKNSAERATEALSTHQARDRASEVDAEGEHHPAGRRDAHAGSPTSTDTGCEADAPSHAPPEGLTQPKEQGVAFMDSADRESLSPFGAVRN